MDLEGPEIWKSHGTHPLPRSRDSGRFRLSLPGLSHLPAQRGAFCRRLFCRFSAREQISKWVLGVAAGQFSEATQVEWVVTACVGCPSGESKQVFIHGRLLLSVFSAQKSRSRPLNGVTAVFVRGRSGI